MPAPSPPKSPEFLAASRSEAVLPRPQHAFTKLLANRPNDQFATISVCDEMNEVTDNPQLAARILLLAFPSEPKWTLASNEESSRFVRRQEQERVPLAPGSSSRGPNPNSAEPANRPATPTAAPAPPCRARCRRSTVPPAASPSAACCRGRATASGSSPGSQ